MRAVRVVLIAALIAATARAEAESPLIHRAPNATPSAAYRWLDILLEASGRDADKNRARPTILSRISPRNDNPCRAPF